MKVTAALIAYTVLLSALISPLLARARWPARAPRWGIAAWQALSASSLLAVAAVGVALAMPGVRLSNSLSALLRECVMALRAQYRSPGGAVAAILGETITLLVVLAGVVGVTRELLIAAAARRRHRTALAVAGRAWEAPAGDGGRGAGAVPLLVEHARPLAYCLPGRGGRIVLSSAAVAALEQAELEAVLAHERAHLAGRHHLVLAVSVGLARAFWFVPLFQHARAQIAVLVEMLADDRAVRNTEAFTVAAALLALASSPPTVARAGTATALAASETATGTRVRRLLSEAPPLRRGFRALAGCACVLLVSAPFLVLLAPALAYANTNYCPA